MIARFEFATATRIIFGAGALREIGPLAKTFGRCALVVTGRNRSRAEVLISFLTANGVTSRIFSVSGEPQIGAVQNGAAEAKQHGCDLVISYGGGSALDAGKAIAGMLANPGDLLDYLEVIGKGLALSRPAVPFIAIPATAGTGTEVTRNAVLASPPHEG